MKPSLKRSHGHVCKCGLRNRSSGRAGTAMMETWKECGWAPCGKRFEPSRRSNRHQRATASRHDDAIYCSRACRQKAYRWRSRAVTRTAVKATARRAVTRPFQHIENIERFSTKNEHPRSSFQLPDGYVLANWEPSWQPHWPSPSSDDLSIPEFLKRESAAISESPEGLAA